MRPPESEVSRLQVLESYGVLDTPAEEALDDVARLAANLCGTPIALVSIVDRHRLWFKARVGTEIAEVSRTASFCACAVDNLELTIVPDARLDSRFTESPLVAGEFAIRFYAGAPLISPEGAALGTLCVLDHVPRILNEEQKEALRVLGRQVMTHLNLRRQTRVLEERQTLMEEREARSVEVFLSLPVAVAITRWKDRKFVDVNAAFCALTGYARQEVIGHTAEEMGLVPEAAAVELRAELQTRKRLESSEVIIRSRDGEARTVLLSTRFVELTNGRHAVSTFVDITARKRAEAALEEHTRYLGLALDAAGMGAWKLDLATGKASTIQGSGPISGQGDLPSLKAFLDLLHPDDREAEAARMRQAFETSDKSVSNFRVVRPDGSVRWVAQSSQCARDASGCPIAVYGVDRDITDRKAGEFNLNRLAAIVESSSDAIISKNLSGTILTWNRGAEQIFGYTAGEIIGTSIMRLIPEERQVEETRILEKIRRGEPVEHFETKRRTKDGRLIDIAVSTSPIKDASGKVVGASKIARDITESRRARVALRKSEEQFQVVMNAIPQLAWIAQADGSIFWYNQRWYDYTGTTLEDMKGWGWQRVHDPAILPAVMERWTTAIAAGESFSMEFPLRSASGEFRWFLTRSVPLRHADGTIYRWLGTNTDISEKRGAEEEIRELNATLEQRVQERTAQLQAANKELEAFSYSVSHDLRAPLRAVDGFSQAVMEDYAALLPAEGQRYLKTIRDGAQRMGALIDDLLAFARLGRAPLNKEHIDVERQVRDIFRELTAGDARRVIDLRTGHLPACSGDPMLLRQVWVNLISNALKYSSKRAESVVEIGTLEEKGEIIYFVRDNGTGFDMRYAHKLFGVFQRLHRQEEFAGTGVGLAIVQRIIHRHGGRIWAVAEVDRGATFYFTLEEPRKR